MHIAGFNPNSFVDYPNYIAAVIFVGGCNFDCWYCHNKWLLDVKNFYNEEDILKKIFDKKDFIDGVVITGGEPTVEDTGELLNLIMAIKSYGLKVKLDTNGTNFETLEALLPYLDYVAMDVKAPLSKYREVTCIDDRELISLKKSIELLKTANVDNEFRTTFIPTLNLEDILEIAHTLEGCKHYYLQQFVPTPEHKDIFAHPPKFIKKVYEEIKDIVPCAVRGI